MISIPSNDDSAPFDARFLRLAAALSGNDADAVVYVVAEIEEMAQRNPVVAPMMLLSAARVLIGALRGVGGTPAEVHKTLQDSALAAMDFEIAAADRLQKQVNDDEAGTSGDHDDTPDATT